MHCQFDEHETMRRSTDERVQRLAKLAEECGVLIHIDGMPYGSNKLMIERGIIPSATPRLSVKDRITNMVFGSTE